MGERARRARKEEGFTGFTNFNIRIDSGSKGGKVLIKKDEIKRGR